MQIKNEAFDYEVLKKNLKNRYTTTLTNTL